MSTVFCAQNCVPLPSFDLVPLERRATFSQYIAIATCFGVPMYCQGINAGSVDSVGLAYPGGFMLFLRLEVLDIKTWALVVGLRQ